MWLHVDTSTTTDSSHALIVTELTLDTHSHALSPRTSPELIIDPPPDELAAVIIEPYQRTIPPAPGFLEGLRRATSRHGVPLVFDEIVTGFFFVFRVSGR